MGTTVGVHRGHVHVDRAQLHLLLEGPRGRVYADQASCDELSLGYSAPLYPVSRLSVLSLWVGAVLARTSLAP